jgi:putative tryptophan/tyrosine transport system substrate-binding protein
MRRREFITLLGGTTAAWPLAVRAQQGERIRRIGVLMGYDESDPDAKGQLSRLINRLPDLGWTEGRNLSLEVRWAGGNVDRARMWAKELVKLQPDVILAHTTPATAALQRETRTIPLVFVTVADPVGSGFVASLARPGGNITGFMLYDPSMGGKWLELLLEIAPRLGRVAAMFNPNTAPFAEATYVPAFEAASRALKVMPIIARVHDDAEIESVVASLGQEPRGGLVLFADSFAIVHRAQIISVAARENVPTIFVVPHPVREGGLLSYGADEADLFRQAAPYVDRILRGEKPAELPVQMSAKFLMALNLRTAKALGLDVPQSILVRADEVIE